MNCAILCTFPGCNGTSNLHFIIFMSSYPFEKGFLYIAENIATIITSYWQIHLGTFVVCTLLFIYNSQETVSEKFHSCLCIKIPVFLGAVHTVTRRIPCKQNAAKYVPNPDGPISQVDFGSPRSSLKMAIANSAHHAKQQNRMRLDIDRHNTIRKCLQSTPTEEDNFFPCERGVFLTQDIL